MASPLEKEKQSWLIHHITRADSPSSLNLVETDININLCYYESKMYGCSYKHYFLDFFPSRCIAEFRGDDHFNETFEIHNKPTETEITIETKKEFTPEMKERLREVEHMNNYSLVLRNCEHITKYVIEGVWFSLQVITKDKNNVFWMYLRYAKENAEKLINSRPIGLGPQRVVVDCAFLMEDRWDLKPIFGDPEPFYYDRGGFNVLLIGPTGSGKSNLINHIYKKSIAESKRSASGITQQVLFYPGTYGGLKKRNISFIDTVGFCDRQFLTSEIIKIVMNILRNQSVKIDRVLIVVGERIRDVELEALKFFKKNLDFESYEDLFTLVLTKCDDMDYQEREEYAAKFHSLRDFATFRKDFKGTSLLTDEVVIMKRTVTVGLKDLSKITDKNANPEEREHLLRSILCFHEKSILLQAEGCCRIH